MASSSPGLTRHKNSMNRLTDEIARMQSARFVITTKLDQDIRLAIEKAEEEAQKFLGLKTRPQMGSMMWVCKDSPNCHCWYAADDYGRDECIICGNPEERK